MIFLYWFLSFSVQTFNYSVATPWVHQYTYLDCIRWIRAHQDLRKNLYLAKFFPDFYFCFSLSVSWFFHFLLHVLHVFFDFCTVWSSSVDQSQHDGTSKVGSTGRYIRTGRSFFKSMASGVDRPRASPRGSMMKTPWGAWWTREVTPPDTHGWGQPWRRRHSRRRHGRRRHRRGVEALGLDTSHIKYGLRMMVFRPHPSDQ